MTWRLNALTANVSIMVVPVKNGTVKHARRTHVAEYFKDIRDMERHFFAIRTQLHEQSDISFRVKIPGIHPSSVRQHYLFCHLVTHACGTAAAAARSRAWSACLKHGTWQRERPFTRSLSPGRVVAPLSWRLETGSLRAKVIV